MTAFIHPTLTSSLPPFAASRNWANLRGFPLADPDFLTSGPIDIIIGADFSGSLIETDIVKGWPTDPIAQRTLLGWVVLSPVDDSSSTAVRVFHTSLDHEFNSLSTKFWVQEDVPSEPVSTPDPDEAACERHFLATHSRDGNGQYVVRLLFKAPTSALGDSYSAAWRCLLHLQRQFSGNTNYSELYTGFLQKYETLSHMVHAPAFSTPGLVYYPPHHGMFREHSTTSKLRVVFNGSCKTSTGVSLNDLLHTGAKIQQDTSDVLLWIRRYRFIFVTDITKMYRQIKVHPDDWDFQLILRTTSDQSIVALYFTTVTYGMSCTPFLVIRVMLQLAQDEGHNFPLTIPPLTKGRYVDGILGGANTIPELRGPAQQLTALCNRGGFPVAKWSTNASELLTDIDSSASRPDAVII